MSDQRELNMTHCEADFAPPTEPRLFQYLMDLVGYSALRSLGRNHKDTKNLRRWDGLEPLDMLRGWRCGED